MDFNPDSFMSTTTEAASSTEYPTIPESEYPAVIKDIKARSGTNSEGNPFYIMDVVWSLDDQEVKDITGLPEPTVRQSLFLDIGASGALETGKGKNVGLGRLREAINQNQDGQPWAPNMLLGQVARVSVKNRIHEGKTYSDVKGVAAMG